MILAMQLKEGLALDEKMCDVEKYCDGMLDSLPKSKSPTKNACRMEPLELAELRR